MKPNGLNSMDLVNQIINLGKDRMLTKDTPVRIYIEKNTENNEEGKRITKIEYHYNEVQIICE